MKLSRANTKNFSWSIPLALLSRVGQCQRLFTRLAVALWPHLEKFSMATFSNLTILFLKSVKKPPFKFGTI